MLRVLFVVGLGIGLMGARAPAYADEAGKARALALFADSNKAYKAGNFEKAAELLREAHALYPEPILMYNLARALEGMGDAKGAVAAYEQYLAAETKIEDRGAIERRVATLKEQIKQPDPEPSKPVVVKPKPKPIEPEPGPERPEPRGPRVMPFVVAGIGLVTLAGGTYFGVTSRSLHDEAASEPIQAEAARKNDRAKDFALYANVSFVAGGVLAASGLIWAIADYNGRKRGPDVAIQVGAGSIGIAGSW